MIIKWIKKPDYIHESLEKTPETYFMALLFIKSKYDADCPSSGGSMS